MNQLVNFQGCTQITKSNRLTNRIVTPLLLKRYATVRVHDMHCKACPAQAASNDGQERHNAVNHCSMQVNEKVAGKTISGNWARPEREAHD